MALGLGARACDLGLMASQGGAGLPACRSVMTEPLPDRAREPGLDPGAEGGAERDAAGPHQRAGAVRNDGGEDERKGAHEESAHEPHDARGVSGEDVVGPEQAERAVDERLFNLFKRAEHERHQAQAGQHKSQPDAAQEEEQQPEGGVGCSHSAHHPSQDSHPQADVSSSPGEDKSEVQDSNLSQTHLDLRAEHTFDLELNMSCSKLKGTDDTSDADISLLSLKDDKAHKGARAKTRRQRKRMEKSAQKPKDGTCEPLTIQARKSIADAYDVEEEELTETVHAARPFPLTVTVGEHRIRMTLPSDLDRFETVSITVSKDREEPSGFRFDVRPVLAHPADR